MKMLKKFLEKLGLKRKPKMTEEMAIFRCAREHIHEADLCPEKISDDELSIRIAKKIARKEGMITAQELHQLPTEVLTERILVTLQKTKKEFACEKKGETTKGE